MPQVSILLFSPVIELPPSSQLRHGHISLPLSTLNGDMMVGAAAATLNLSMGACVESGRAWASPRWDGPPALLREGLD